MTARPTVDHSVTAGSVTETGWSAARAIALLVAVRDELELAARPPGEFATISRQAAESILNDLRIAARLIRQMAEGVS